MKITKDDLFAGIVFGVICLTLLAVLPTGALFEPMAFSCADCELKAKTENSISEDYDEIYLEEGQFITAIYIKAGQSCLVPDGTCYRIVDGGIGFSFVVVERIGDGSSCQAISHLEVCYDYADTPTPTSTEEPTSTSTSTVTPDPTGTITPDPTETPRPTETPWVPTRTKQSGNG